MDPFFIINNSDSIPRKVSCISVTQHTLNLMNLVMHLTESCPTVTVLIGFWAC